MGDVSEVLANEGDPDFAISTDVPSAGPARGGGDLLAINSDEMKMRSATKHCHKGSPWLGWDAG
jgi:hypothetical protein